MFRETLFTLVENDVSRHAIQIIKAEEAIEEFPDQDDMGFLTVADTIKIQEFGADSSQKVIPSFDALVQAIQKCRADIDFFIRQVYTLIFIRKTQAFQIQNNMKTGAKQYMYFERQAHIKSNLILITISKEENDDSEEEKIDPSPVIPIGGPKITTLGRNPPIPVIGGHNSSESSGDEKKVKKTCKNCQPDFIPYTTAEREQIERNNEMYDRLFHKDGEARNFCWMFESDKGITSCADEVVANYEQEFQLGI